MRRLCSQAVLYFGGLVQGEGDALRPRHGVRWPPVLSGLNFRYENMRRIILTPALWIRQIFSKAFLHASFAKIAAEFFTEAAVLIFVFPVLDRIVEDKPITTVWVLLSIGFAMLFLFLAGILSRGE
jgi:hypothetical protein